MLKEIMAFIGGQQPKADSVAGHLFGVIGAIGVAYVRGDDDVGKALISLIDYALDHPTDDLLMGMGPVERRMVLLQLSQLKARRDEASKGVANG